MSGALVLVATPIGNLEDLSPRAIRELGGADLIACEDTRRTGRLLSLMGIERRPLLRVDDHTEAASVDGLLERIGRGERVVLVSDGGMPAISDPGERLVRAVVAAGGAVEVVPGPDAVVTALVGSGLATARFCFEGFLPRKAGARRARLAELAGEERTLVLYEAPHRLVATLTDLAETFGAERSVVVARELTKLHEQWWRGTLADAAAAFQQAPARGEIVLVIDGAPAGSAPVEVADIEAAVLTGLRAGGTVRTVASQVAGRLGVPRRAVYDVALRLAAATKEPGPR